MEHTISDITANKRGWVTAALHVLIWMIVFSIPYIFNANVEVGRRPENRVRENFLYLNTGMNFLWVFLFYFHALQLFPKLIYKKKIGLYVLVLVGFFCLVVLLDGVLFHVFIPERVFRAYNSVRHNLVPFVFTLAVSAAYKAIRDKTRDDMMIREKQSENLKTELSFLRSQISPHFIFNVLNNIVALVRLKSDELEPTVIKLSSLMQYMLYETDDERVLLKTEIEYLQNYIDLQKQRFGPELSLTADFSIREEWHTIEPMLLIPFVENAFKHGSGLVDCPEIIIQLTVDNNTLDFMVKNRYEERESIKDKTSGIGLQNVKRRLELLHPGGHVLTINKEEGWYIIHLQLTLP